MSALTEVVTWAHENSCNQGVVDLVDSVKELLTRQDMNRFQKLCEKGVHVDSDKYELYAEHYENVVNGETQLVQVSIGITSEARSWEDEATGWGECHHRDVGRRFCICFIRCPRMLLIWNLAQHRRTSISTSSW